VRGSPSPGAAAGAVGRPRKPVKTPCADYRSILDAAGPRLVAVSGEVHARLIVELHVPSPDPYEEPAAGPTVSDLSGSRKTG